MLNAEPANTVAASRKKAARLLLITGIVALGASGCASKKPTFGDRIENESDQFGEISEKWNDGEKLVRKGKKLIKKGTEQISDGRENKEDGEDMVERGERMIRESEQAYESKSGRTL